MSFLLASEVKLDSSPVYFYTRSGIGVPFIFIYHINSAPFSLSMFYVFPQGQIETISQADTSLGPGHFNIFPQYWRRLLSQV